MSHGPFSSTIQFTHSTPSFGRDFRRTSTWYRSGTHQRYATAPLPYTMTKSYLTHRGGVNASADSPNEYASTFMAGSEMTSLSLARRNVALADFINKAQGSFSASLAETLAQWKQADEMIAKRAQQLFGLARAVRRRDWNGIKANIRRSGILLDRSDPKQWRRARAVVQSSKNFGERWLELHFGWVPLLSDIHNSLLILGGKLPANVVRGKARTDGSNRVVSDFPPLHKNNKYVYYQVGVRVQGIAYLTNPNAALLSQLGLDNPLQFAWELLPYSFVVDWFWDVSGFLSSFEGVPGCTLRELFYTTYKRCVSDELDLTRASPGADWVINQTKGCESASVARVLGLPPYHLLPPSIPRFSPTRAATAIALLLKALTA